MHLAEILVLSLVELHGPDAQRILVNPQEVVSIRAPAARSSGHFARGVYCLLQMVDGKFIAVIEPCDEVRKKLEGGDG